MRKVGETWPKESGGAGGRRKRRPANYTPQLNAQGFLSWPQTMKMRVFGSPAEPAQGWTVPSDLFALFQPAYTECGNRYSLFLDCLLKPFSFLPAALQILVLLLFLQSGLMCLSFLNSKLHKTN